MIEEQPGGLDRKSQICRKNGKVTMDLNRIFSFLDLGKYIDRQYRNVIIDKKYISMAILIRKYVWRKLLIDRFPNDD